MPIRFSCDGGRNGDKCIGSDRLHLMTDGRWLCLYCEEREWPWAVRAHPTPRPDLSEEPTRFL